MGCGALSDRQIICFDSFSEVASVSSDKVLNKLPELTTLHFTSRRGTTNIRRKMKRSTLICSDSSTPNCIHVLFQNKYMDLFTFIRLILHSGKVHLSQLRNVRLTTSRAENSAHDDFC